MAYAKRSTLRTGRISVKPGTLEPFDLIDTVGQPDYLEIGLGQQINLGLGFLADTLIIWGQGLVSFGPATPEQIAFMQSYAGGSLAGFPGVYFAVAGSAQEYPSIGFSPNLSNIAWYGPTGNVVARMSILYGDSSTGAVTEVYFSIVAPDTEVSYQFADGIYHSGAPSSFPPGQIVEDGTEAADLIYATSAPHILNGLGGDDILIGGPGDDILNGDGGDDFLDGGDGDDTLNGGADDDDLATSSGDDIVAGGAGDDTLFVDWTGIVGPVSAAGAFAPNGIGGFDGSLSAAGGASVSFTSIEHVWIFSGDDADVLTTASGNDVLVTRGGDDVINAGAGDDIVFTGGGDDMVSGEAGNDFLQTDDGSDAIDGGTGSDTLVIDWVEHDSAVTLSSVLTPNPLGGFDGSYAAASGQQVDFASIERFEIFTGNQNDLIVTASGDDEIVTEGGDDDIAAGGGSDIIFSGAGDDEVRGGDGNDFIQPGVGVDFVDGGTGFDTLEIVWTDNGGFRVAANLTAGAGAFASSDGLRVDFTSIERFRIFSGSEADRIVTGSGNDEIVSNAGNDVILGGAGNDIIFSGIGDDSVEGGTGDDLIVTDAGNDYLHGGVGADRLFGGVGNDLYIVDNAGDAVTEDPGAGTDTIQSSISHVLGANVENLTLTGAGFTNGTGNGLANLIIGNAGANTLDGGGGADTMLGGDGNDTYMVDNVGDVATEVSDTGGTDRVISTASFVLGNRIENLTLAGAGAINGTGNSLANIIIGNGAANVINGGPGADSMQGGLGNDTYVVDNAGDSVAEGVGAGTDTVQSSIAFTLGANVENLTLTGVGAINGTGNAVANLLRGNAAANILTGLGGDDRLDGGAGADTMIGGLNNDTYVVDNAGDIVTEAAGQGIDTIEVGFSYTLPAEVERLTLTGLGSVNGTGNGLANLILGNAGANILDGAGGADTMLGGDGNDTYMVDHVGDIATEVSDIGGTDTVLSSVTFILGANIERLTLTGAGAINGTGNGLANLIIGNGANNVLNGLAGADTMQGGLGNDTYVVDNAGDIVAEGVGAGTDTIQSSISITLAANVESLILTGLGNINGTGNSVANVIIGNVGSNTLDGAAGADTMLGGDGDDTYLVDNGGDIATEVSDTGGTDRVISSVTYFLGNRIENLTLAGAGAIDGNGNGLGNMITGNGSANVIRGGLGADTLTGNGGNDRFRYDNTAESTSAVRDDITDFSLGDLIDLSIIDANGPAAGNAFTFIGGGAFSGTAGELRVVALGGDNFRVEGDTNGDGVADLVIDVTTIGGHVLGGGDFVL